MTTYAPRASITFNEWLGESLSALAADVRRALGPDLVGLIMSGGYGRGEGAVEIRDTREVPYNDIDLILVTRTPRPAGLARLQDVRWKHESRLGVEVDFSRPFTTRELRAWPHWLMWHDVRAGHKVLHGPTSLVEANTPVSLLDCPPAIEGTRLLLNRGAGLVQALRVARGVDSRDPDFVRRNLWKAVLAAGDAVLIAQGIYSVSLEVKGDRLERLAARNEDVARIFPSIARFRDALEFKLSPSSLPSSVSDVELHAAVRLWANALLHVESQRTGRSWASLAELAADDHVREPDLTRPGLVPRNAAHNLRLGRLSLRYPRESLHREIARLLDGPAPGQSTWQRDSERFLRVWKTVN